MLGCPPINPCLNNGKCYERPFGFACLCPSGFHGNRCQYTVTTLPSIILTNPMSMKTLEFEMFDSSHTHNSNIDPSCKYICKNKGVCLKLSNSVDGFKCQCLPQFTGKYCELKFDFGNFKQN